MNQFSNACKIILCTIILISFFAIAWNGGDTDIWWHLTVGQNILRTQSVPFTDTLSFTMQGYHWVDHEWLAEMGIAFLAGRQLWWLIVLIFALATGIPFFFWIWRAKNIFFLMAVLTIAILMTSFMGIRPVMLSFLFFFVLFEILRAYPNNHFRREALWFRAKDAKPDEGIYWYCKERGERLGAETAVAVAENGLLGQALSHGDASRSILPLLPVLFLLWANIHAGFFAGLIVFGIFWGMDVVHHWQKGASSVAKQNLILRTSVFALSIAAAFANPYGPDLFGEIWRVATSGATAAYITEWQSALMFPPCILVVAIFIFFAWKSRNNVPPQICIAAAVFFIAFVKAVRMAPFFFVVAMPIFEMGCEYTGRTLKASHNAEKSSKHQWVSSMCICMVAVMLFLITVLNRITSPSQTLPAAAAEVLREEAASGRTIHIFNYYDWGGYLEYTIPDIQVFIDGRMPHWVGKDGVSPMREYAEVAMTTSQSKNWQNVLDEWNINTVLYPTPKINKTVSPSIFSWLFPENQLRDVVSALRNAGWKVVYQNETATLLQR